MGLIFLILLLALVLRLINLNQSLWLDEAVQAITAKESIPYIFQEIVGDFHPPLYHFLMHFWVRVFGSSEIALRMPSVIFGVITVYTSYLIAGEIKKGKFFSLVTAFFLATAPFHVYYSQEVRMYSLVTMFSSLSVLFFLKTLKDDNKLDIVLWLVFSIFAVYSDYYAWLVLLSEGIYLLFSKKTKYIKLFLIVVLFYLPWLPMFFNQVNTGIMATRVLPEWGKLVNLGFFKALPLTFIKFSLGRITIFNKAVYAGVAFFVALVYGVALVNGARKREVRIVVFWLAFPLIISWLFSLAVPNYQPFRLLLVIPAFYLLLAFGIGSFNNKTVRVLLVGFVIAVNLASISVYYFNSYFHREDWKGVADYVIKENASAILPSETSAWPLRYYDSQNKIKIAFGGRGIEKVGSKPLKIVYSEKVFYIRYLVPLFDPQEKILSELESSNYSKIKETSFNQIPVWEFELKP